MPRLDEVAGARIAIYAGDHNPPHFHAKLSYSEEARIRIDTLEVMTSTLPPRVLRRVLRWAGEHQGELALKWIELNA